MSKEQGPKEKSEHANGAAAYLARTLTMNPIYEADEVVALRARALRLERDEPKQNDFAELSKRRTQALERLEAIRKECWSAPSDQLLSRLESLKLDGLPDIQAAAERLKVVLSNRAKFPQLASHKKFDGDFFSCLKTVLAESPRETAVLREQVLASFRSGKLRKRGRRMIKLIEKELPELYALEADWFASLMRQKRVASPGGGSEPSVHTVSSDSSSNLGCVWWIVAFIVIRVLVGLIRNS